MPPLVVRSACRRGVAWRQHPCRSANRGSDPRERRSRSLWTATTAVQNRRGCDSACASAPIGTPRPGSDLRDRRRCGQETTPASGGETGAADVRLRGVEPDDLNKSTVPRSGRSRIATGDSVEAGFRHQCRDAPTPAVTWCACLPVPPSSISTRRSSQRRIARFRSCFPYGGSLDPRGWRGRHGPGCATYESVLMPISWTG